MDLKALPKAELHCHLELCFRHSTLIEIGKTLGIEVPSERQEFRKTWLAAEPIGSLSAFIEKIMLVQSLWASEEAIERMTYEACEDAVSQGIKIIEFRYSPTFIQIGHSHLSFEKTHGAILKGLKRAQDLPLATGLIGIILRDQPMTEAEKVFDFVTGHKDSFVGLDLANNESGFDCRPFAKFFHKAKEAGLGITVHAGEEDFEGAALSVQHAINELGADRIGHGLQIWNSPDVIKLVCERKIPLEICPTSNWITNSIASLEDHPIQKLREAGVLTTINSDDPGMFDIDLTGEYGLLERSYGFTLEDFNQCNDIAAASSFISYDKKQKVWPRKIRSNLGL